MSIKFIILLIFFMEVLIYTNAKIVRRGDLILDGKINQKGSSGKKNIKESHLSYEGRYRQWKRHGQGTAYYLNKMFRYEGTFNKDNPTTVSCISMNKPDLFVACNISLKLLIEN